MDKEEGNSLVGIIVCRELVDVVVSPAGRQPDRLMVEGIEVGWVGGHDGR